jgi:hypothetical protein
MTLNGGPKWVLAQILRISTSRIARNCSIGPKGFILGPTQTSSHPTWQPTWHKYGAKILGPTKENGPRFSLTQITALGPN